MRFGKPLTGFETLSGVFKSNLISKVSNINYLKIDK